MLDKKKKEFPAFLIIALLIVGGILLNIFIDSSLANPKYNTVNITTTINQTLEISSCATTANIPAITPGTSQGVTNSACTISTNAQNGWNMALRKLDAVANITMRHTGDSTPIFDNTNGLVPLTTAPASTNAWVEGTTKGLGMRMMGTSTLFGSDASPEYAAFPAADIVAHSVGTYNSANQTVNMAYRLDVPVVQKSGSYAGSVYYTYTTNP